MEDRRGGQPPNTGRIGWGELPGRLAGRLNRIRISERAIRIGADRLYADSVGRYLAALAWKLGWRNGPERALIAREVMSGMVAVDVGASVGWYTFGLARRVGSGGRVYAIEPEARGFRLLSRSLGESRLEQVQPCQVAAADHAGWMTLYVSEVDHGDHRIFPAEEERRLVTVRAVTLDDLLADEARVDFVKINVQGAEVSVLRGLRQTLKRSPDLRLLCSLCPALLRRAGAGASALFDPLRELGFSPYRLAPNGVPQPIHDKVAWSMAVAAGRINLFFRRPVSS